METICWSYTKSFWWIFTGNPQQKTLAVVADACAGEVVLYSEATIKTPGETCTNYTDNQLCGWRFVLPDNETVSKKTVACEYNTQQRQKDFFSGPILGPRFLPVFLLVWNTILIASSLTNRSFLIVMVSESKNFLDTEPHLFFTTGCELHS